MASRLWFIIKYWLCWIFLFAAARVFFFLFNFNDARRLGLTKMCKSMFYGLRMDMSMAAYVTVPAAFFLFLALFIGHRHLLFTFKIYTTIVAFLLLLLVAADVNIFSAWGYRLDATPLKYLTNPAEAWASVANLPLLWILLLFTAVLLLILYLFYRFITAALLKIDETAGNKFKSAATILSLLAMFIIPIRGGLQLAALNQSSVYFCDNNFANQSALNAPWNFLHSIIHNTEDKNNPFIYISIDEATTIKDSLFSCTQHTENMLDLPQDTKPNIIFIIWESFTEKVTHMQVNGVEITPNFNALKKEGIYFSNMYAAGDRTDKGIVAVLSGYPSQPVTSIVKMPVKAAKLPMVSESLAANGYSTSFYYGGELEFANMKAYLLSGAFNKFVSKNDFDIKDQNSKWGAHDGVVMEKLLDGLNKEAQPFFCTWLTLSSHEPFETPVPVAIPGTDDVSMFLNSLHYTDAVVYDFIQGCKRQAWWKNSLIVITADHGHRMPATGKKIDDFKIPVLILGGALKESNVMYDRVGSQVDIAATVLAQVHVPSNDFVWSKNLLNAGIKSWAYFSFTNGYGFVQPSSYYIFDNVGRQPMEQSGFLPDKEIKKGKAIEELSYQDYLDK